MANNKTIQALLLVAVFIVMAALVLVLNIFTAPLIEANAQGAELEPLYGVMPEASGFEKLSLEGVPETVSSVWKENGGLGYVVRCATNKGFTGDYIELTVAITEDGRISGISLDSYPETKDFGAEYPTTFVGQDSTLAGTSIVAGVTYSSSAFRNAVADAFDALVSNGLIKAGVKEPSQVISEMLPVVFRTAANPAGIAQVSEFKSSVPGVKAAWKTNNGIGVAYWYEGDSDLLVIFNSSLSYQVFDLESNDVTTSFDASVAEALSTEASGKMSNVASKDQRKVKKLVPDDAVLTQVPVEGVFNSVSTLFKADSSSGSYYCFTCRPFGFSNETMVVYVVLDSNGRIYAFNADELIIEAEYFSAYTLDPVSYKAGFVGLDSSWSGEEATVSGATMTSQAVRCAIDDAFEAFGAVAGGSK